MPDTRPANYYLGCLGGSVCMDFDNHGGERIRLKRISFDGYGCCELNSHTISMGDIDSHIFKQIGKSELFDQLKLTSIIKKTILDNKELIWKDALKEYHLL